ncbi:MAG TPA: hypothetical protein DC049_16705, partial [Spirochaetia bacterium]|nr:hypothetical protein [Spirochaetia bacterium]
MKLKIGAKLITGFLSVAVIAAFIGTFSLFEMGIIQNSNQNANGTLKFNNLMVTMKMAHLNWRINLGNFQRDEKITRLEIEKNPHNCAFGKWFYSEAREKYEKNIPEMKTLFSEIEPLHNHFHKSADDIEGYLTAGKRKEAVHFFGTEVGDRINVCLKKFDDIISTAEKHAEESIHESDQTYKTSKYTIIIIIIASIIVAITIGIFLTLSITGPLRYGVDFTGRIAEGDLTHTMDKKHLTRGDEIGELAQALSNMNDKLVDIITNVHSATEQVASASEQIARGNQDLSSRTETQASALEETASS